MNRPLVVLDVVGMTPRLLAHLPRLEALQHLGPTRRRPWLQPRPPTTPVAPVLDDAARGLHPGVADHPVAVA
jgi:hypothetical protein